MELKELVSDDGLKKVHSTGNNDQVVVSFSDGGKKKDASDLAVLHNAASCFFFDYLSSYNVPTYFIKKADDKSFVARKVEEIPMFISVYNVATKSLAERFDLEEGQVLEFPILEMYYKDAKKQYPMINEYHAYALGLCDRKEMTNMFRIATKTNAVLKSYFDRKHLKLVGFSLQFGRTSNQIVVAGDLSFENIHLWPVNADGSFEKISDDKKDLKTLKKIAEMFLTK